MKRLIALPLILSVTWGSLPAFAGKKAPTPKTEADVVSIRFFPPEDGVSTAEVRDPKGVFIGGLTIDSMAKKTVFAGPLHTEGGQTHQTIFIEKNGISEQGTLTISPPSNGGMVDSQALEEGHGYDKKQAPGAIPYSRVADADGYPIEDAVKQELAARLRKEKSDVLVMVQDTDLGYKDMDFFVGLPATSAGDAKINCGPQSGSSGGAFDLAYMRGSTKIFKGLTPKNLCPKGRLDFKAVRTFTERAFMPAPRDQVKAVPGTQKPLEKGLHHN